MSRPGNPLADRLLALGRLKPRGAADAQALLALLAPPAAGGPVPVAARRAAATPPPPEVALPTPLAPIEAAPSIAQADPARQQPQADDGAAPRITRLPRQTHGAAPPAPGPAPGVTAVAARPAPLIAGHQARGVLVPLVQSPDPNGPLDLPRLVHWLSLARPMLTLPRRPVPSVRRGAQLLIDRGEALQPLSADVQDLTRRLSNLLGRDLLQTLRFDACPLRGAGPGARWGWTAWRPPAAGVPVLLLTDLGVQTGHGDAASPREWLRFASQAHDAGCPVVALVPYPLQRVPVALQRVMTVLPWCESLSAARARRILRDARRLRR